MEPMGFNLFAAADARSPRRLSNPYFRSSSSRLGTDRNSYDSAQNSPGAGANTSFPWAPHDQSRSPISNNRPSLAKQIETDKRRERRREAVARVQREEGERVKAYRERTGYSTTESENGSVNHLNSGHSDTDGSISPPAHPGNLSPSNSGQIRG